MLYFKVKNILSLQADVVVMSANSSLLAGSGISGLIHKNAGPELEQSAKHYAPLNAGCSIITPGFNLKAKYVVHTVCPRFFKGSDDEINLLSRAYESALNSYDELEGVKSIAFVSMGTGIYRWPLELAAEIAVKELLKSKYEETIMCLVDKETKEIYQNQLEMSRKN
jgi:O-acetyl-ADP-ribose deacetylase